MRYCDGAFASTHFDRSSSSGDMSASFLASKLLQNVVELHHLEKVVLNGKRGLAVEFDSTVGRVAVDLAFIASNGNVKFQRNWILPEHCLVVAGDCTSQGVRNLIRSPQFDSGAGRSSCHLACCIADQVFEETLDERRNPGWWKLPLEVFLRHLFKSVMRHLNLAAPDMDIIRSQMACGRLRIDGSQIDWESTLDVLTGDVLMGGSAASAPHRVEIHLDDVVPHITPSQSVTRRHLSVDDGTDGTPPLLASTSVVRVFAGDGSRGYGIAYDGRDGRSACAAGDVLLSERPLARLPRRYSMGALRACVGALPREHRQRFFALGRARAKFGRLKDAYGIWQTNALPLSSGICEDGSSSAVSDEQSDVEAGVFELFSRVNHSCMPNARTEWDANVGELRLIAMDSVAAHAELTISYGAAYSVDTRVSLEASGQSSRAERRQRIKERFGFWCACIWCREDAQGGGEEDDHADDEEDSNEEESASSEEDSTSQDEEFDEEDG